MSEILGYKEAFDREFYSCDVGLAKPDLEYFRSILRELGIPPENVLFIDDKLENVCAAQEIGLLAEHLVYDTSALRWKSMLAILQRHGFLQFHSPLAVLTRRATPSDLPALRTLRREAILEHAPKAMPLAQARKWAEKVTVQGMEEKFRKNEIWIAESDKTSIGWISFCDDFLTGLYTDPKFAN
jgi:hypothetical protein